MVEGLQWSAALLCLLAGAAAVVFRSRGLPSWCFLIGMLLLAGEQVLRIEGGPWKGADPGGRLLVAAASLIPAVWFGFSLIYGRGNRREYLRRWRWALPVLLLGPLMLGLGPFGALYEPAGSEVPPVTRFTALGKVWLLVLLVVTLGVLINLESTFRASVGMTRWRIKYLFMGMGLIFGVRLYGLSQALLFDGNVPGLPALTVLDALAMILGCVLVAIGHSRSSFGSLDIYPSRTLLQGSFTVVLAGAYFVVVGLLAQVVRMLGGAGSEAAQAFLLLSGLMGLTVLLLSDRFRSWLQRFVSRHFRRPEHDYRKLWTEFTRRTSSVLDAAELGKNAGKVVSESFNVLAVSIFRLAPDGGSMQPVYSTAGVTGPQERLLVEPGWLETFASMGGPVALERREEPWVAPFQEACGKSFEHGGERVMVPLVSAERLVGVMTLADRVGGRDYSQEEFDLLSCISDQLAAGLLNCRLTEEVLQGKELEAFQTLSTFFVHDLKNAANSLSLTLQNLPVHFDDPEFRKDAVGAVGQTVERINKMILNLSSLRRDIELRKGPCRLDQLIREVLDELEPTMDGDRVIVRDLQPLPELWLDEKAIRGVLVNLMVNAKESLLNAGKISVTTLAAAGQALVTVADEGAGMTAEFVRTQLFRPFHSTKSKGLGIGMFQCKKIMEAHHGGIRVESEVGSGTRMTLWLPVEAGNPGERDLT